jgi:DNA-binding Lrp family transcriptional regulator
MKRETKQEIDIIHFIREDARTSLTRMARQGNMPIATAYNRLEKVKQTKIKKIISLINPTYLRHPLFVCYILTQKKLEFTESLVEEKLNHYCINDVIITTKRFE